MITIKRFAQECKESQVKYMAYAKRYREDSEARKSWINLALVMRRNAREWATMS
ncbi:TPA: hypothetical protein ACXJEZ_001741 [Providencia rettgeri]